LFPAKLKEWPVCPARLRVDDLRVGQGVQPIRLLAPRARGWTAARLHRAFRGPACPARPRVDVAKKDRGLRVFTRGEKQRKMDRDSEMDSGSKPIREQNSPPVEETAGHPQQRSFIMASEGGKDFIRIILSVIIPPVGVFFQVGLGLHFWINILLTLLGYIPGLLHAIWIIVKKD